MLTLVDEVQVAENVKNLLRPYGDVSLPYITANLEPFSTQSRPDIVFVPRIAPTNCFCIELRFGLRRALQRGFVPTFLEHYDYVHTQVEFPVFAFALATDNHLEPEVADMLMEHGIRTFSSIAGAIDLADRVMRWARLR